MAAARSSASSAGDKSTLRMVLFFACILACIGCMYLLIDFQTGLKPKLSGELILGQVDTVSYQHQDAPLRNFLFEYFGLLSYLLAAMIVYVGYFVCLKPTDLWHIDFYKTSLRILGFNFLFLGGAALLSRYSDLINTGAGGLLGDMLNMFCDLFLPHVVSVFIFAFLAFSGLTFLLGSSPNRVFERVGAGFFKVVPSKSEQNKAKSAKAAKSQPDADAAAIAAAAAGAASVAAAAPALASATEQEQGMAPSESMGAMGSMEAPNAAAPELSVAEPMANNGPVNDFFAQAQQGMVGALAPEPAFVGATVTSDNRDPRAVYEADNAYAADAAYAADNSAANIAAEGFGANGPALGGGDPSILQPIDPRNPVSLPAEHQEQYEDQAKPYHRRDLEHEAVLDGLNAAEQQPYEPYAPYPEDVPTGMSQEMVGSEQAAHTSFAEQAAQTEQDDVSAYEPALQEQQAQMAADPSLAPFANNQLYASQAVAEPMKGNELEQVPSPDVAPMPAMPHLQSAQAPQAPEPYSPYAAYQAQQAHAQAQQALQQYGDLSQSGDNSVGVSEHSMQGEMDAPLAPVQGATLDDIPSVALDPATSAALAVNAASGVGVDESASEAATVKQYTEVTQESRHEAEVSPYGYGTYAEQFVGRKLYPFNDGTQEQAGATDAASTALESDNTVTQDGAAESVVAADTETPAAEPKDDGEVHTIVQRVDPEVFAAQLAAQKKAREEAAKAELERLEKEKAAKVEEEAKAKAEAEAKEKAEAEAEAAAATAQESAGSELAEQDQVEAIDDDESDEEEEPIYAGTYASHLKQQKAATEKTEAKQDPDDAESSNEDEAEDEDDEDDGPKYITPGAPAKPKKVKKNKKKQVAETAEDEAESEESEGEAAPRTIIQDTRKEFEAAQERAKAEAEAKAKAEEEARLAAEAEAKAEEEARLAAEAEAKAKAEEEARLAAEAEAKAKAEEEARLAAEAEAKAKAEEEARLAAEAEAKAKAEEEARLAAEAKAKAEAEAAAQRESKESAIIAALSSLATELKNVTDSSLTSRHAHDESLDAGLTTAAATTAAAATAATAAAATDATAATAGVALNNAAADASLAAESVITSVQVSDLPVRDDPAIEQELESDALQQDSDSFTSNTHIQKGSGAPDAHLSRPELNPHTTITRGPSVDSDADDDFLNYAVARNNAQQAGEVQDGPVTVNLFSDYLEESKKREQSLYQPQHSYDFGQGQQVGTVDESLAGQVGSDSDGVDDFVTGATHLAQAPVRTQKFNFAQLAQAKAEAEAAAAHEVSAQPAALASASAADAALAEQVTADASAQSEKDDNIIAFNNFGAHEPQTYEVGDLTPAFIPMPNEEANPAGGHLSSGELSSIYEQDNAEAQAQAQAQASAPVPETEAEADNDSEQTTAVQAESEDSAENYEAEEYDYQDESNESDDVEELDADDADDADDYDESDDADDDEYYEEDADESDSEDEPETVAQVQGAEAVFNQGGMQVNNGSLMNPMMNMANRGMQSPQTMYQTMPNGQQVQYVQMPNGQYMPVMQNGMMYQNMSPNMGMAPAMNPMGNMPMQNMPQLVQLPNGQYVQMVPNAQNMMYSQMQQLQQMQQMQQLQTNQGMTMPTQGMPAQGMMPNMTTAALQGQNAAMAAAAPAAAGQTVPAGQTATVEDSEPMGAGAAPVEPVPIEDVPDLEDRFTDGLPDSAAAMARELLDEDESDSVVGTHGMGAHEMGAHGASGVGFPTAGNAFMGAHNSSSSNLPSYMAGVPQAAPVSFDAPKSLSLCSVPRHNYDSWRPELSLLARSNDHVEMTIDDLNKTSERINSVLHSFGVKASVADYITGPVITRFDLDLKPGVKSSAISSIDKELCRNLLVSNVRVVPFIDGSSYVGLEVPNPKRKFITLGDMVTSREFQETKASLPMCLGASVVGTPVVKDLAETPHLLVAGTTGSGKSAGLNTMLISLLLKRSPAELRLILVDPKQLEFSIYKDLPHLITPVITDVAEKTPIALHWCVEEMERRFKLMSLLGVRKLSEYNELIRSKQAQGQSVPDPLWTAEMGPVPQSLKPLPWIVVVVEEFADLMAQSGRKKDKENTPESLIARLSAKSRAAGIHLVLVTQTPRSEVVTGMIKANFPSRIAFTVQSRLDSTIVLDDKGAETLLGNGDMLYKFTGASSPTRAHGAFTSNDDVKAVVDAWRQKAGAPEYLEDVIAVPEEEKEPKDEEKTKELDVKFDQAVELVRSYMDSHNKLPTITDLQTELGVGYPRAKKIFKQLTSEGIID